jgi:hypothetical protein
MNVTADQIAAGGVQECRPAEPPPPNHPEEPAGPSVVLVSEEDPSWVVIQLVDDDGLPVPGAKYRVELPDGRVVEGTLDRNGRARVEGIADGECQVSFPDFDGADWRKPES